MKSAMGEHVILVMMEEVSENLGSSFAYRSQINHRKTRLSLAHDSDRPLVVFFRL